MTEERNCSRIDCYPEDTGCQCGETDYTKCKHYKQKESESNAIEKEGGSLERFPWTGSTLGLHDLNYISSHSNLTIIGVVGTAKTGKTTFLALLYCLLRHGYKVGDFSFAGSYTLTGWEDIASNLSWKSDDPKIQFPPHTTSNAGRVPGLLHLALKGTDGLVHNVIFTDAPGEWFKNWSVNKKDINAEGANWIYKNAHSFLMFADCEKLAGAERGAARNDIMQLFVRLKENIKNRQVCLIWSKSDIEIHAGVKDGISKYLSSNFSLCNELSVSARKTEDCWQKNVLNSIDYVLASTLSGMNPPLELPVFNQDDLFLAKRR
jgi:hypothetical protein